MCLAIPGEIVEVSQRNAMRYGRVQFGGVVRDVCLEYQPAAQVGDFVLVHVGFAIATVDREEAARTLAILRELGEEMDELDAGAAETDADADADLDGAA
jgi:hydrogenase expression/formation protein HypC